MTGTHSQRIQGIACKGVDGDELMNARMLEQDSAGPNGKDWLENR